MSPRIIVPEDLFDAALAALTTPNAMPFPQRVAAELAAINERRADRAVEILLRLRGAASEPVPFATK